jgi:hypothetical protein
VAGPSRAPLFKTALRFFSTGESSGGHGDVQIIRLDSVDNIADVAVFDDRGIVVLRMVWLQVVHHPLLSARRVWN